MDFNKELSDIKDRSYVIFDWDNTLKIYDKAQRTIRCRFTKQQLQNLKQKGCELFIISAIAPRKLSLETLLLEVKRLGLEEFFMKEDSSINIKHDCYARKGNVIACGYDKAETFLEMIKDSQQSNNVRFDSLDVADGPLNKDIGKYKEEDDDIEIDGISEDIAMSSEKTARGNVRDVVFFDDEEVNIHNFREIVKGSICHHVI